MSPSSHSHLPSSTMHVLIVGAGLGGVMLAALLEKAQISYLILERAEEVKSLGSATSVSISISAVFKQLGIFDELLENSLPLKKMATYSHPPADVAVDDFSDREERYGEFSNVISRPRLYDILRKLVPAEKILCGKQVVAIQQNDECAMIMCSDNTKYYGDIIVGADGAYSTVRNSLYKELKTKGLLPNEDDTDPPFNTLCLVGVTRPLSPDALELEENECKAANMLYKGLPYASMAFGMRDRSVAWMVIQHAGSFTTRNEERFKSSQWESQGWQTMANDIRNLPSPLGSTMGLLIEQTDEDKISKVMLEEKVYKTWYYGRTVLLGDACHKVFPTAGQGAMIAMQDAVVLANVLEAGRPTSINDIGKCFETYRNERYDQAHLVYTTSHRIGHFFKKTVLGDVLRFILARLPRRLLTSQLDKLYHLRPQAAFLPQIPPKGKAMPLPQPSYDHLRTVAAKEL